jgi:hypothetical protein
LRPEVRTARGLSGAAGADLRKRTGQPTEGICGRISRAPNSKREIQDHFDESYFQEREVTMHWVVACLLFITGMTIYFPTIFIRKVNRVLKALEQIESNTRKS